MREKVEMFYFYKVLLIWVKIVQKEHKIPCIDEDLEVDYEN